MKEVVLEVKNLVTEFKTGSSSIKAVNDVSFSLKRGSVLGVVGESGSGKSTIALSLLRIIDPLVGNISSGEVIFDGIDLVQLKELEMQKIRGNRISMIFQDPMTSLNPLITIGEQISEVIVLHQKVSEKEAKESAIRLLELVSIADPEKKYNVYPHQISGGMRQRVMIAIALACKPDILIADEPTTALDVTIQAQIMDLLKKIQQDLGMSIILITHDLGLIAEISTEVAVMYCGKIVEYADTKTLFNSPQHPYTIGLLNSIPSIEKKIDDEKLPTIEGTVPSLLHLPKGCAFCDRCKFSIDKCTINVPVLREISQDRSVACFNPQNITN